jgi:hypothetical protein
MQSAKAVGRTIGVLFLAQGLAGPLVNFVLLKPLASASGFLASASANAPQIGIGVLLGLVTAALSIAIAIAAWPILRRHSRTMALVLLALAIAGLPVHAIEDVTALTMLSLSQAYATVGAADVGHFEALGVAAHAMHKWAHFTNLFVASGMLFVFYAQLYRQALIPRALAAFAVGACALQLFAFAMPFLGYRFMFSLLMPMALAHLASMLWLIVRGFDDRMAEQTRTDTPT